MFPPSFQDGFSFAAIPDTSCLANFRLCLRHEPKRRAERKIATLSQSRQLFCRDAAVENACPCRGATLEISQTRQCLETTENGMRPEGTTETFDTVRQFCFCYLSPRKAETRTNATERNAIASAIIIMISFIVFLLPFVAAQNNLPMLNISPEPTINSRL
jgi:hypothetical protein